MKTILFQSIVVPIRGVSIAGYLSPSIFGLADGGMSWGDAISAGAEISSATATHTRAYSILELPDFVRYDAANGHGGF